MARLHLQVAVLDLGAVGAGQLHLLLIGDDLLATLTLVHHLVSRSRIFGGASTVSSTGRQVDHLLAVVDFDNGLLTQDLTRALQFAGCAASISVCCLGARFTVQGVEVRTYGIGLLSKQLSIDVGTCIFRTPVIRWYKCVVDLNDMRCVSNGEHTALLNTRTTALINCSLIFITFRAVCLADDRLASNDV